VRGPQSQRKSSSADAQLCKDRQRKQCNLSSYCAAPQPLCSASCGTKCARKWHFHGNSHTCHLTHILDIRIPQLQTLMNWLTNKFFFDPKCFSRQTIMAFKIVVQCCMVANAAS